MNIPELFIAHLRLDKNNYSVWYCVERKINKINDNVVGQMNISVINFYCVLFQPIMSIESLNENKKQQQQKTKIQKSKKQPKLENIHSNYATDR
jgi:hypothetical protein